MTEVQIRPKPWFAAEPQDMTNKKDQLRKNTARSKCERALENLRVEKKAVKKAINDSKDNFFKRL